MWGDGGVGAVHVDGWKEPAPCMHVVGTRSDGASCATTQSGLLRHKQKMGAQGHARAKIDRAWDRNPFGIFGVFHCCLEAFSSCLMAPSFGICENRLYEACIHRLFDLFPSKYLNICQRVLSLLTLTIQLH